MGGKVMVIPSANGGLGRSPGNMIVVADSIGDRAVGVTYEVMSPDLVRA